jgi:nitrogen regulatory protein PII
MHTVSLKLVTIVAERLFREQVTEELRKLGAKGFTVTDAEGKGSRGIHASEWEGRNVRIETVVAPEVADRIVEHVAERYFEHYAVIVWVQSVEVVRGEKYL